MLVLGLSGGFAPEDRYITSEMEELFLHDAAACLLRDGQIVAAVEEERLSRVKKTSKFPVNAIAHCLNSGGVTLSDLDAVSFYFKEDFLDSTLTRQYLTHNQVPLRYSRELIHERLREAFGRELQDERLVYTRHHEAHAVASYMHSGMNDALAVVMDGMGERESVTVYQALDGKLDELATYPSSHSLGMLYLMGTMMLGYKIGDEYKVMGLAPYGDPARFRELFRELHTIDPEGGYEVRVGKLVQTFADNGFRLRRKGEEFSQQHKDFAAALQEAVEVVTLHMLAHWRQSTGLANLCLSGGVAHNCSMNGRILRSGLFDRVFVHPASHDAGAAVGAAMAVQYHDGNRAPGTRLRNANWGPALGDREEIEATLTRWDAAVRFERSADIVETTSGLLADGAVVAWTQGGSEFGPRALGNRSILADARPKENQTRINAMVKMRESFRPFAPVVVEEAAHKYFEIPADSDGNFDFMSFVLDVREEYRSELGAVTHVDGTARVQVIDRDTNDTFWRLVTSFGDRTGMPVLLNTSFNNNAEPIVQSVADAITTFLTTDLDYLVIGDFLVSRREEHMAALDAMVPSLPPITRLSKSVRVTASGEQEVCYEIHPNLPKAAGKTLSPEVFAILENADGHTRLREIADGATSDGVREELHSLWRDRHIALRP